MANTYTQIYLQFVLVVKNRKSLIQPDWEPNLHKYITRIVEKKNHKMIAINGMPDHLHMFVGYQPAESISEFMKVVKGESSKWIEEEGFVKGKFNWQIGYGAFSYSRSHIDRVYKYIMNQKEHHQKRSFRDEYVAMLKKHNVDYDERFIFKTMDIDGVGR